MANGITPSSPTPSKPDDFIFARDLRARILSEQLRQIGEVDADGQLATALIGEDCHDQAALVVAMLGMDVIEVGGREFHSIGISESDDVVKQLTSRTTRSARKLNFPFSYHKKGQKIIKRSLKSPGGH